MKWWKVLLWTLILLVPCGIYNDHMGIFYKFGIYSNREGEKWFVLVMSSVLLVTYWQKIVTNPLKWVLNHDKLLSSEARERANRRSKWYIIIGLSPIAMIFLCIPFIAASDVWSRLSQHDRDDVKRVLGLAQPATHRAQ